MPLEKGWLGKAIADTLARGVKGMAGELAEAHDLPAPEDTSALVGEEGVPTAWGIKGNSWLGAIVGAPLGFLPYLMTVYQAGLGLKQSYDAARIYEPSRLPPRELINLIYRGFIEGGEGDEWLNDLRDQGWSKERIDALKESFRPLLGYNEVKELYLRGYLGEGAEADAEAVSRLMAHGFSEGDAGKLTRLFYFIPPPQDIVTWYAREVFEPKMIKRYGLDDELPDYEGSLFPQAGVSEEQARNYWRAHWQHASWTQVAEMLHRGYIDEDDVWDWFRLVEIPPFWRDKLIKIAYTPFTRVDIRRMYRIGVLDDDEVVQAYMDIGYNREKAEKLLEFTKKYYPREDQADDYDVREMTKSEILRGYRELVLDAGTAREKLEGLNYSPEVISSYLTLEDLKAAEARTKERLRYIKDAYTAGLMPDSEMYSELGNLNLTGEEVELYAVEFREAKLSKVARPSKSDLMDWLKKKIIPEEIFVEEMRLEGYAIEHIRNYVIEILGKSKVLE